MKLPDFFGFLKKQQDDKNFSGTYLESEDCGELLLPHELVERLRQKERVLVGCRCGKHVLEIHPGRQPPADENTAYR